MPQTSLSHDFPEIFFFDGPHCTDDIGFIHIVAWQTALYSGWEHLDTTEVCEEFSFEGGTRSE
jgi:hypothetical protein